MSNTYFVINTTTNICENVVLWNGNNDHWSPPSNYICVDASNTKSKVWSYQQSSNNYVLIDPSTLTSNSYITRGNIGDTWDGNYFIPPKPSLQPSNTQIAFSNT